MTKKELSEAVWSAVDASKLDDQTQRSALGIARQCLETGKQVSRQPTPGHGKRDDLAEALLTVLQGSTKKTDQVAALAAARSRINAPFLDEKMQAERARQVKAGPVGSEKKNTKMGLT